VLTVMPFVMFPCIFFHARFFQAVAVVQHQRLVRR